MLTLVGVQSEEVVMGEMSRRAFLKIAGAAGVTFLAACQVGRRSVGDILGATPSAPPESSLVPAPTKIIITPTGELYTQSFAGIPDVVADDWRLRVHGLVSQEKTLSLADVRAYPKVEESRTLECIGNPVGGSLIGNVVWGGFAAQALWEEVGIQPQATRAKFEAEDDYYTSVALRWITQPGVLLVYELNGEALPKEHGYPVRILMPGLYGQKMPKWIRDIEFIDHDYHGYWESRGWSDVASVQTNSIIQQPPDLDLLPAGSVPVFGVAFAGLHKITKVEVRLDDGAWTPAALLEGDSSLVWTQWSFDWPAAAGRHTIAVRATDDTGFVQTTEGDSILSSAYPAGTDNIHSIVVTVV